MSKPTLWHIEVSHRSKTFPVLSLDGRRIGDSTAIIAALEQRYPDPPLYPSDYGVRSEEAAALARGRVSDALDYLESELGSNEYLVGDSFSVADLTAASLFYPLVLPPEAPRALSDPPEAFQAFRAPFEQRRGFRWVERMFSRHRN